MISFPILSAIVFIPLFGGLMALACAKNDVICRWIAIAATLLDLLLVLLLFFLEPIPNISGGWIQVEDFPWIQSMGIRFTLALDGISLVLILLTSILGVLVVLVSWNGINRFVKIFHFFLLAIQTGVLGVFLATDLFVFFLFWELQSVPMFFIIGIWGHEQRIYASVKFALFSIAGSLLMMIAIISLYLVHASQTGEYTFSFLKLMNTSLSWHAEILLFSSFILSFIIKVPLVPVHTWLPDAHTEAPTAGSVILAGLLLKTGVYALIRFGFPLFPYAAQFFTPFLVLLGLAGIFYAGWIALVQEDLKRLVAYSSIAHMGLIIVGIGAWNITTLSGSVLQMINHGITTSALFIMTGMLDERLHTRKLSDLGGLWKTVPIWSGFFLFFAIASIGLPGLNNFVGEILILIGTFKAMPWTALAGFSGLLWTVVYVMKMLQCSLWGKDKPRPGVSDLSLREFAILAPLCLGVFWLGLHPGPALGIIEAAVTAMLDGNIHQAFSRAGSP